MEKKTMATKRIEIFGRERETAEGKKFIAWRAKKADGTLIDCRFTREVKNIPDFTHGFIEVENNKANISNSGIYPVLWVKAIVKAEEAEKKDTLSVF